MIILATFSGCKAPNIKNQIRRVYSIKFDRCYCQWYDLNNVKAVSKFLDCRDFYDFYFPDNITLVNDEYCDDLVGFSAKTWATSITPWGKEVMRYGSDACN